MPVCISCENAKSFEGMEDGICQECLDKGITLSSLEKAKSEVKTESVDGGVAIVDIKIPMWSVFVLVLKFTLASIPIMAILFLASYKIAESVEKEKRTSSYMRSMGY